MQRLTPSTSFTPYSINSTPKEEMPVTSAYDASTLREKECEGEPSSTTSLSSSVLGSSSSQFKRTTLKHNNREPVEFPVKFTPVKETPVTSADDSYTPSDDDLWDKRAGPSSLSPLIVETSEIRTPRKTGFLKYLGIYETTRQGKIPESSKAAIEYQLSLMKEVSKEDGLMLMTRMLWMLENIAVDESGKYGPLQVDDLTSGYFRISYLEGELTLLTEVPKKTSKTVKFPLKFISVAGKKDA